MAQRLPPPSPENFTLGLAGFGSINIDLSHIARTTAPVSCRLSFPQTKLDIALAEQKCQAAVIALLQQRLEEQDGGAIVTPTPGHLAEPSRPKKTHKRSRRSRKTLASELAPSERRTVFNRLEQPPRTQPAASRPHVASIIHGESSRSSATNSTAHSHRTGASGRTHHVSRRHQERANGKRPMDLNTLPGRQLDGRTE